MKAAALILNDRVLTDRAPMRREEPDDQELIERFLSHGAEECFEQLVDRYKNKVFRLAASVMGSGFSAEAEDIAQEVFIQVYRKLTTFRRDSRFSTWLYRIAYNRALERKRKARFRIPHQGEELLNAREAPREQADPVAFAEQRRRNRSVLKSLDDLDEPFRTAIYLHYWMNCSIAEIAEQLGTKPNTVKSYLFRGRQRLAQSLKKERNNG